MGNLSEFLRKFVKLRSFFVKVNIVSTIQIINVNAKCHGKVIVITLCVIY